ncbi:unnamed protein product [Prorocentrum cordatum]|uniref:Uncharacterized protein n=1 Tax=Prorocentrum cordatum TaxID=2364126 RepID=A0ABN9Y3X0_9DINO|nr:unnamed protein product [Polarella glacialis]
MTMLRRSDAAAFAATVQRKGDVRTWRGTGERRKEHTKQQEAAVGGQKTMGGKNLPILEHPRPVQVKQILRGRAPYRIESYPWACLSNALLLSTLAL